MEEQISAHLRVDDRSPHLTTSARLFSAAAPRSHLCFDNNSHSLREGESIPNDDDDDDDDDDDGTVETTTADDYDALRLMQLVAL